jgi:hypothetical protein
MPRLRRIPLRPLIAAAAAASALAGTRAAHAVLFYTTGDPSYNTTAPTGSLADSGWQWQGDWGPFSGTPVGTHYFMTAQHVGGGVTGTFTLDGNNYTVIPFADSDFKDVPGTDMRLWHVDGTFPTYASVWDESVDGTEVGQNLTVFGRGTQRGAEIRLPDMPSGTLKGWQWGPGDTVRRWGENQVTSLAAYAVLGDDKLLEFDFDASGPGYVGVNEAGLSSGDSGGGVFIKSGNQYKLAGINLGVDGPFSYTSDGPTFIAPLFDAGGLWFRGGTTPLFIIDTDADIPTGAYASRVTLALATIAPYLSPTWNVDADGVWSNTSNWQVMSMPSGVDAEANFRGAISATHTVNLDGPLTVGTVYFDNANAYTIAGGGASPLTFSVSSGSASINVLSGSHAISAPMVLASDTVIDVKPPASVLTLSGDMSGSGNLTKTGPGRADVKHVRAGDLTISDGTIRVVDNAQATGVSVINNLSISGTGKLDLRNNKLIARSAPVGTWNGTSYTDVSQLIAVGRNGNTTPLWDGASGIITSLTDATTGNFTTIGVARASDVRPATVSTTATWAGQTITGSDTLVMYTFGGDANLDGKINIDDYVRIDSGIAAGLSGWSNGDFNYDGKVNIDDYTTIIDANIGNQNNFVFPSSFGFNLGVSAVPEPNAAFLVSIASAALFQRFRRHRA